MKHKPIIISSDQQEDSRVNILKIVSKGNTALSKNQQTFNNLIKRIGKLEREIVSESERLQLILTHHGKEISPLQKEVSSARIQLAITLDLAASSNKFSKLQMSYIQETITQFFDDAFVDLEPTPEQQAIYDKWSEVSYEEGLEEQRNDMKSMFTDMIYDNYGIDVDLSDLRDNPEEYAQFHAKMKEQYENQQRQHEHDQKKSKKQLEKEKALKAETEIKNKSLRSIYIALAKVLHPDTDPNGPQMAEKEEIMKQVTVAYEQKDLTTLLKLEMEWVLNTTEHLSKLSDEKLKIYISALKQQVDELEDEKFHIAHNPIFHRIMHFAHLPLESALKQMKRQKKDYKIVLSNLNQYINQFKRPDSKKQVVAFTQQFCEEIVRDYLDHPF